MRRLHTQIIEILAQHSNQNQALEISEKVLLSVSLRSEGATIREPAELKPIQDRFKAAVESLAKMTSTSSNENLKKATSQLGYFGQGETSVFARHARELSPRLASMEAIDENVAIQRELDGIVAALVSEAEQGMGRGTDTLFDNINSSRMLLLLVVLASIVAAALAVNHVQRKLVLRLLSVENAMRRLSSVKSSSPFQRPSNVMRSAAWPTRLKFSARAKLSAAAWPSANALNRCNNATAL